jgi:hypothetical protein
MLDTGSFHPLKRSRMHMVPSLLVIVTASLLGSHPVATIAVEEVDLIEVNHLFDERGQHLLDQLIFYEWSDHRSRYDVRAWRKIKSTTVSPLRSWQDGGYHITWCDRGLMRHVKSAAFRETWTQHDPEVVERQALPVERRRELRTPRSYSLVDTRSESRESTRSLER